MQSKNRIKRIYLGDFCFFRQEVTLARARLVLVHVEDVVMYLSMWWVLV